MMLSFQWEGQNNTAIVSFCFSSFALAINSFVQVIKVLPCWALGLFGLVCLFNYDLNPGAGGSFKFTYCFYTCE